MHGFIWPSWPARQSTANPRFRHRQSRPVLRAMTGASILLGLPIKTSSQKSAAELVGSNCRYVEAAVCVLRAEAPQLLADVYAGREPLLSAAAKVRRRANLIIAYREASSEDRAAAGAIIGVDNVFDEMIAPAL